MHSSPINFLQLLDGRVQYVVPRWQRRYCWGQADIERLVEDLLAVAAAEPDATHYGGTLLTFPEPGPEGVVRTVRVVDGQQRLTTVSILLACIGDELGPNGDCEGWTKRDILDDRLTNPRKPPDKFRKLRLQDGDEEEYRDGLLGSVDGAGAVSQAWRTARRIVVKHDLAHLLRGLKRLRVVSIGLDANEDPQQIFESLNATGRPLTESEKVKNWLLMGLPDAEQQDLHDKHWLEIERKLDARYSTERIDIFLRDVLRWWTGETQGIDRVYEGIRRWAVTSGRHLNRPALCRELNSLASLYGILAGTTKPHTDANTRREIRHLQAFGIHVHRPLSLRLLHDLVQNDCGGSGAAALATTLRAIGTWVTRMWFADKPMAGLNKSFAELAHEPGPGPDENFEAHWLARISRLRNTRVGVPGDADVREGIRTRKAYGGSATRSTFAVLCELMEAEHGKESVARGNLTVEHVMPQKLTEEWKEYLGVEAEEFHGQYRDRIANLTLTGFNQELGARTFVQKQKMYGKSTIGMTQRLADVERWDEGALEDRAHDLAERTLARWPWADRRTQDRADAGLRWRIEDGEWQSENWASQMVLNVAAALLDLDSANADKLAGERLSGDLQRAIKYPPGTKAGTLTMRAVPGHSEYVLYPYNQDFPTSARRCRDMGNTCGIGVDVEINDANPNPRFWKLLKEQEGGLPGQKDSWRGGSQWTAPLNRTGDRVGIYVGNEDRLWLYIKAAESEASQTRVERMRPYSRKMRQMMGDQDLGANVDEEGANGRSIAVRRPWVREDEDAWPDAAQWIKEQFERLHRIVADPTTPVLSS